MIDVQPLSEASLARECLRRLSDKKSVLHRAMPVLDLIARGSVGLGEVLQDYARQSGAQLQELIRVAGDVARGTDAGSPDDRQVLENIHYTLKAVKAVLDMTPQAMKRNKSPALGEKEKLTGAELHELAADYIRSPDVARLLASEDSGHALAALIPGDMAMAAASTVSQASAPH